MHSRRDFLRQVLVALGGVGLAGANIRGLCWVFSPQAAAATDEGVVMSCLPAAGAVAVVIAHDLPVEGKRLGSGGCRVWCQPGAALVVGPTWGSGERLSTHYRYAEHRAAGLRAHLPEFVRSVPPVPREEDIEEECASQGQVYVLDAGQAHARLRRYYEGYQVWMQDAPEAVVLSPGELEVAAAVVYVGEGGPLELYFRIDESGKARLIHLVQYDYFSA